MTQLQLAERLNVGRSAVANWESATDISPASARLREIAMLTRVGFEWLATGRGIAEAYDLELPAVDAELIDDPLERRLLNAFRACRTTGQKAVLTLAEATAGIR